MGNNSSDFNQFNVSRYQPSNPFYNNTQRKGRQISIQISSWQQQDQMMRILEKRCKYLAHNQYICSINKFQLYHQKGSRSILSRTCQYQNKIIIYYRPINYRLCQIPLQHYSYIFSTHQIYNFIYCVGHGLLGFRKAQLYYGDLYMDNIGKYLNTWQIIDKDFYKNGLSAYQTVLEGQPAFITPDQMERIRHGFIRQSPKLQQTDDIFALGMIVLQLGSLQLSVQCYQRSFTRLNYQMIQKNIQKLINRHNTNLGYLVRKMIENNQQYRITLNELLNIPEMKSLEKKKSLAKPYAAKNSPCYGQTQQSLQKNSLKHSQMHRSVHTHSFSHSLSKDHSVYSYNNQKKKNIFYTKEIQQKSFSEQSVSNQNMFPLKNVIYKEKSMNILPPRPQPMHGYYNNEYILKTINNKNNSKPMFANSIGVANFIRNEAQNQIRAKSVKINRKRNEQYGRPNHGINLKSQKS